MVRRIGSMPITKSPGLLRKPSLTISKEEVAAAPAAAINDDDDISKNNNSHSSINSREKSLVEERMEMLSPTTVRPVVMKKKKNSHDEHENVAKNNSSFNNDNNKEKTLVQVRMEMLSPTTVRPVVMKKKKNTNQQWKKTTGLVEHENINNSSSSIGATTTRSPNTTTTSGISTTTRWNKKSVGDVADPPTPPPQPPIMDHSKDDTKKTADATSPRSSPRWHSKPKFLPNKLPTNLPLTMETTTEPSKPKQTSVASVPTGRTATMKLSNWESKLISPTVNTKGDADDEKKASQSSNDVPRPLSSQNRKPSEVRAALKTQRAAARAEQERQNQRTKNQQLAQMKMDKIRAEINSIKEAQQQQQEREQKSVKKDDPKDEKNIEYRQLKRQDNPAFPPSSSSSSLSSSKKKKPPSSSSFTLVPEMRRRISHRDLLFDSDSQHGKSCTISNINDSNVSKPNSASNIKRLASLSNQQQKRIHVVDELRQNMSTHSPVTGQFMVRSQTYSPPSRPSFSSGEKPKTIHVDHSDTTNTCTAAPAVTFTPTKKKKKTKDDSSKNDTKHSSESVTLKTCKKKKCQVDKSSKSPKKPTSYSSLRIADSEPKSPRPTKPSSSNALVSPKKPQSTSSIRPSDKEQQSPRPMKPPSSKTLDSPKTPTVPTNSQLIRCSITTTPKKSPKQSKEQIAKLEEEKERREEQRKKLDEAKAYFVAGHDLCWKFQDSNGALGEYRKALFIRESTLGKYHDETGRLYYWIGRSLFKLGIYTESLVALTRAQRIFERVLSPTQKYRKWTEEAIQTVFRQMGGYYVVNSKPTTERDEPVADDSIDADGTKRDIDGTKTIDDDGEGPEGNDDSDKIDEENKDEEGEKIDQKMFKLGVDQSIEHETAGDTYRREGCIDEAVGEYRQAIALMNSLMHAHPDSADLYCKIAMLLRQQGSFDLALEEQKDALAIYELSLGMEHPNALKTLSETIEKKRTNQMQLAILEKLGASKKS